MATKKEPKQPKQNPKPLSKVKIVEITDQNRYAVLKSIFKF